MRKHYLILGLFMVSILSGQSKIDWDSSVKLKLEDFQSPQTEINKELTTYSIFSGASLGISFHMTNGEFILTKNFNSKVTVTFDKIASIITAPDSLIASDLVSFGQYAFNLTELYARKLRKELYENKGAFSSTQFYQPIYEKLQSELNSEIAKTLKESDLGRDKEVLSIKHKEVLLEIASMPDFCRLCKPEKIKRKKKK